MVGWVGGCIIVIIETLCGPTCKLRLARSSNKASRDARQGQVWQYLNKQDCFSSPLFLIWKSKVLLEILPGKFTLLSCDPGRKETEEQLGNSEKTRNLEEMECLYFLVYNLN